MATIALNAAKVPKSKAINRKRTVVVIDVPGMPLFKADVILRMRSYLWF